MLKIFKCILFLNYLVSICSSQQENSMATPMPYIFWPNATIPFYIHPDHFDHEQSMAIMTSLSIFGFKTCLKFAPVMAAPKDGAHVMTFVNADGMKRCKIDNVGHSNYLPHLVKLGYECLQSPELEMMIMRALGFPFEHNRMCRDLYIDVLVENIEPSYIGLFSKDTMLPVELRPLPYDINSVLHFGDRDYSKNGHRTIMYKHRYIRQNRGGLSEVDLKKIEIVYGPECLKRDRQEKIELCQSFPGVARRKRQIEVTAPRSLRVNPDITPPPHILLGLPQKVKVSEDKKESDIDVHKRAQDSKEELDPHDSKREEVTKKLKSLGIEEETEEIIDKIYKLSAAALINTREKYCNTNASLKLNSETPKKNSSFNLIKILETIAEYTQSVVDNAVGNLKSLCENPDSLDFYQRKCKWDFGDGCPKSYRSTNVGAVRHSTNHRPTYKQQTKHEGSPNKFSYDKPAFRAGNDTESTTASIVPKRRKRDASSAVAVNNITKGETKNTEAVKLKIDNTTVSLTFDSTTVKTTAVKKPERRYFKERRYKVKNPKEKPAVSWDTSKVSQESDTEKVKTVHKVNKKKKKKGADKEMEIEEFKNKKVISKEETEESKGDLTIMKTKKADDFYDYDVKLQNPLKLDKSSKKTKSDGKSSQSDEKPSIKVKKHKKPVLSEEDSEKEDSDVETTTKRTKKHKEKKNKGSEEDWKVDRVEIEAEIDNIEEKPKNQKQWNRSKGSLPKTVKLTKLNEEFYNDRRWPDGIVRYVLKPLPDYDVEDLRSRLAEVNSILLRKTCVQLREVDKKEADGYDDVLILDPFSPDYVTGKVGGKQIFGCVELYRGNQHRQHTAMMVMSMLGFYFEVSRHDRDKYIRVHNRHIRPDKLHHFEKIRDEATLDVPYDYKSATHPAWQFWRKIGKTGISTVATYKERDPDGSLMRSLGQNDQLFSDIDILKINSVYGIDCYKSNRASNKKRVKSKPKKHE